MKTKKYNIFQPKDGYTFKTLKDEIGVFDRFGVLHVIYKDELRDWVKSGGYIHNPMKGK
jgi:hypothetical protein